MRDKGRVITGLAGADLGLPPALQTPWRTPSPQLILPRICQARAREMGKSELESVTLATRGRWEACRKDREGSGGLWTEGLPIPHSPTLTTGPLRSPPTVFP